HRNKGLRAHVEQVLAGASAQSLKPLLVILFFSIGVDDVVSQKLGDEFGAIEFGTEFCVPDSLIFTKLEGEWVYVVANSNDTSRVCGGARAFQLKVDIVENTDLHSDQSIEGQITGAAELPENPVGLVSSNMFCSLISGMNFAFVDIATAKPEAMSGEAMVNFDTTALVALISGISNGGAERLLTTSESEMRDCFKNNFEFVMAQVMSELQNPILTVLQGVISGKQDNPSERMMGLPTTRKIAVKNKIIFGTGDYWCAPALTANMGFARAIPEREEGVLISSSIATSDSCEMEA
ncbi:uncharacterized protein LOC143891071, partial [Tasmannia lanceolata]|uniref:uncharacterized protein LOC143891071 n=1 Tax=Tasmannia lanceolata TaxID=3420 RepID=UPI004063B85B